MKKLFAQLGYSFITGLVFSVGIVAGASLLYLNEESKEEETITIFSPEGIDILSTAKEERTEDYVVTGTVKNTSGTAYEKVDLKMYILAGKAQVNSCFRGVGALSTNEEKAFVIRCNDADGTDLPENITNKIEVYRAIKVAGT